MQLDIPRSYIKPNVEKSGEVVSRETFFSILESGDFLREDIGVMVRDRYSQTARQVDHQFEEASKDFALDNNPLTLNVLRQTLGKVGAFNYIRGISILKKDHSIDRIVAPRVMITPSASIQLLNLAKVTPADRVLELFCGVGYFSFFLALEQPAILDCIDLYSPQTYDLDQTYRQGFYWIYAGIPDDLKPHITQTYFIQHDVQDLASCVNLHPPYSKVFLHPPFGRESTRIESIGDMDELQAFYLWIRSLSSLQTIQSESFQAFSLVPTEWPEALVEWQNSSRHLSLYQILTEKLRQLSYYKDRDLRLSDYQESINVDLSALHNLKYIEVAEMRLFRQSIVITSK